MRGVLFGEGAHRPGLMVAHATHIGFAVTIGLKRRTKHGLLEAERERRRLAKQGPHGRHEEQPRGYHRGYRIAGQAQHRQLTQLAEPGRLPRFHPHLLENQRTAFLRKHAAQMIVFHTIMQPGDNFISANKLYGGSINQFGHAFKNFDWHVRWVDPTNPDEIEQQIDDRTRAIFIESLANPGGTFVDIKAIADIAHKHGLPLIVDNTMASPYLLRPIEHGADVVVHSMTKFIGGHGNSMGGVIVDGGTFNWSESGKYPMLSEPRPEYGGMVLHETFGNFGFAIACRVLGLRDLGPALSPFNAFMLLTGVETLPLRMQKHCDNALEVATWLKGHDKVSWVSYSGLEDDPNHALMKKYSPNGAGAVFTFGLKGGFDAGVTFVESLEVFSHLANIGDTRSLVIHPASTTHRQLSPEQQVAAGAGPDVVRLSIGIEDAADIIGDLEQALAAV